MIDIIIVREKKTGVLQPLNVEKIIRVIPNTGSKPTNVLLLGAAVDICESYEEFMTRLTRVANIVQLPPEGK